MNTAGTKIRPRVLVVTRNLPPLIGGMERLVWHIVDELSRVAEVRVVGPERSAARLPVGVDGIDIPLKPLPVFLARAILSALKESLAFKPDLVFAGSGLTAPIAWLAAKTSGARTAVYLHGLDIDTNHFIYRTAWKPFIRRCDLAFVNSRFTRNLASSAKVPAARIKILSPGLELPDLAESETERKRFRARHGLVNTPVLLYVGRVAPRKGLLYFIDKIAPLVIEKVPDVKLVVIGDEPTESILGAKGEMRRVRNSLITHGIGDRAIFDHAPFWGEIGGNDPELSAAYFAADVLIFPAREIPRDVEGFGMVAIEAAAHGLPTVAFSVGGIPDAVKDRVSGQLIHAGDSVAFAESVIGFLSGQQIAQQQENCRAFARRFEWSKFGKRLREYCKL